MQLQGKQQLFLLMQVSNLGTVNDCNKNEELKRTVSKKRRLLQKHRIGTTQDERVGLKYLLICSRVYEKRSLIMIL